MAAVLAPLSLIALWWVATHGKGTAPGRLVAWGSAAVVLWLLVAMKNPSAADGVASEFASGMSRFITGLGHFIGDVMG